MDPCENAFDSPLLYEQGWGKKLTYVIAFGVNQVLDVTLRYTRDPVSVFCRRQDVQEFWMKEFIAELNRAIRRDFSDGYRQELESEDEKEVKKLIEECRTTQEAVENLPGRMTGSLEWKTARGEAGKK